MLKGHWLLGISAAWVLVACGSSSNEGGTSGVDGGNGGPPATTSDAGATDGGGGGTTDDGGGKAPDGGAGSDSGVVDSGSTVPDGANYQCAPHAPLPTMTYWGGAILANPEIVTITYDDMTDAVRQPLQDFGDTVTQSAWWDSVTTGYCDAQGRCIGHGTNGGHVTLKTETISLTDTQTAGQPKTIDDYVQTHIDSGDLPEPHVDTLYAFYLSKSVTVTLDGASSCGGGFGGYHFAANVHKKGDTSANNSLIAYAILPTCGTTKSAQSLINVASHEFIEAATDAKSTGPDIRNAAWGFYMEDPAWGIIWSGQEVADLCQNGDYGTGTYNGYTMTRGWLHDAPACAVPCGPAQPTDVYFGASPEKQVIELAVGESATVAVTAFAQTPMADFQIALSEPSSPAGQTGYGTHLKLAFDNGTTSATVNNGTQINMTVTLVDAPPEDANYPSQTNTRYNHAFALVTATSSSGSAAKRYKWPFTVRQKQ
jgi:hypothetical protein